MSTSAAPDVSVVIPLGPRHEDLRALCAQLREVMRGAASAYEVVIVDDASPAATRRSLADISRVFPEVRVVRLQRPMGEATALAAGSQAARGRLLVTVDPYLHVSLDVVPRLLAQVRDGADLVCTWRHPRTEGVLGRLTTEGFNAAARWLTGVPVHDLNSRTRALRREVLEDLPLYGDLHRFLPVFAARRGYRWREIQVPQQAGKSEVGPGNLISYARRLMDLITLAFLTRFVKRPLHFFGLLGLASFLSGLLITLALTYQKLVLGLGIGHRPLLLLGVLLIVVGLQIASIGLLAEVMIFTHARDLKDYVVEEERG
jgi:glycosyltransferase involved in cell wall biosynthesis